MSQHVLSEPSAPTLFEETTAANTNEPTSLDDKLLYLAEMFSELPVEAIVDIINNNTTASMQILIDKCLQANTTPFDTHNNNTIQHTVVDLTHDSEEIHNTVSWLPPSVSTQPVKPDVASEVKHLTPPNFMSIGTALYDKQTILYNTVRQLHIRVHTDNIDTYMNAIRLLVKIVNNIIAQPDVEKYRLLSLTNAKLYNAVIIVDGCVAIIKALGFTEIRDTTDSKAQPTMLLLSHDVFDISLLKYADTLLTQELSAIQRMLPKKHVAIDDDPKYQSLRTLQKQADKQQRQNQAVPVMQPGIARHKLTREQIAAMYEHKLSLNTRNRSANSQTRPTSASSLNVPSATSSNIQSPSSQRTTSPIPTSTSISPRPTSPRPVSPYTDDIPYAQIVDDIPVASVIEPGAPQPGRISDFAKIKQMKQNITEMRQNKHNQSRATKYGQKHVFTLNDIEQMRKSEFDTQAKFGSGAQHNNDSKFKNVSEYGSEPEDMLAIGHECLRLTNIFRAENNLPPLTWHQSLYEIGMTHSADMAEQRVPFGHDGFQERRVARYPFQHQGAAENVAWNQGIPYTQVAKTTVDGWINSPGHRKNLLSNMSHCAISVYRNAAGAFYLTQLFALVY